MGTMWFDPKHLFAESLHFTALHEIGHVLGFGTLWDDFGYLQDPAGAAASRSPDTHFGGALATAAFNLAGGTSYPGAKVPVENDSARYPAAQDLHWRESVFGNELMTGGVRGIRGTFEPLSSVTVASLADLGYAVNYAAVYQQVVNVVENSRCKLLENLAARIAAVLLADFPLCEEVRVRIGKPALFPTTGRSGMPGVEIVRKRIE